MQSSQNKGSNGSRAILKIRSNWCVLRLLPARKNSLKQAFTCLLEFTFNCRVMGKIMHREPLGMRTEEEKSS